ncbi:MAG: hypothetical protein IJI27_08220 [Oscillospiraceae bacterium]|nr:hypothetical protein [Oscillospiraceae bacterium]
MKAYTMIELSNEEIQRNLPYAIIGETASRSVWETGRRKRLFAERFTEAERELCYCIIRDAKKWLLKTGCPESVKMRTTTYAMWWRLAEFCACI